MCLCTFSHLYIIHAFWKNLNDQSSWFLLSHFCNYWPMSWSLCDRLSQSRRELGVQVSAVRELAGVTWACPGICGFGGTTGLSMSAEVSQGRKQGKLTATQERERIYV